MSLFPIIPPRNVATVTQTDNSVSATDLTTYTFSSQSLGAAQSNRKIIVVVATKTNAVSSVTVGGISATLILAPTPGAGSHHCEIWIAAVPTGTTGDMVVVCGGANVGCGIGVFRAISASLTAFHTASDTDNSDPATASINIPSNGFVIAGIHGNVNGGRVAWTGLTERYDELIDSGGNDMKHSGASDNFAASETGRSISVDTGGWSQGTLAVASFGPS